MNPFDRGYNQIMKLANMSEGPGKSSYDDIKVDTPDAPSEPENPFSLGDFGDFTEDQPSPQKPKDVKVTDSKFTSSGTTVG